MIRICWLSDLDDGIGRVTYPLYAPVAHQSHRICPGRSLADSTMFIAFAMSLAVFDFRKARDAAGREIDPNPEFSEGIIRYVESKGIMETGLKRFVVAIQSLSNALWCPGLRKPKR